MLGQPRGLRASGRKVCEAAEVGRLLCLQSTWSQSLQQGHTGHMGQDNCFQAEQPNHCPARIKAQTKEQLPLPSILRPTAARGSVALITAQGRRLSAPSAPH